MLSLYLEVGAMNYYSQKVLFPVYPLRLWLLGAWPAGTRSSGSVFGWLALPRNSLFCKSFLLGEDARLLRYHPPVFSLINQRL